MSRMCPTYGVGEKKESDRFFLLCTDLIQITVILKKLHPEIKTHKVVVKFSVIDTMMGINSQSAERK